MTNSKSAELALLNAIMEYKATASKRPVWVSAEDISPVLHLPVLEVAAMLRRLEMQAYLTVEPNRMYGSPTVTEKQRYGITPEGARRAAEYGVMKLDYYRMRGQVLVMLRQAVIKDDLPSMCATDLAQKFHEDPAEVLTVLRSLEADGYIQVFVGGIGMPAQEIEYQLTQTGHHIADYYQREGRFPPPATVGASTTNNTYHLVGANSRVNNNSTDSSTNTVNYQTGVDPVAFTRAVIAFRDALQHIQDQDEKEVGELRLSQLERVVQEGKPSQSQWEKFFAWATSTPALVTGGVVLWNAGAAIGRSLGYDIPEAPQGLGQ